MILQVINIICSLIVGGIISYFFAIRQLKYQQTLAIQTELGKKIANALLDTRQYELKAITREVFHPSLEYQRNNNLTNWSELAWIPAFMVSRDSLVDFCIATSEKRLENEPYLGIKTSAYMHIIEKYLEQLALYIGNNHLQEAITGVGIFIYTDICKWQKEFDQLLVKEINSPRYALINSDEKGKSDYFENSWAQFWNNSELKDIIELDLKPE